MSGFTSNPYYGNPNLPSWEDNYPYGTYGQYPPQSLGGYSAAPPRNSSLSGVAAKQEKSSNPQEYRCDTCNITCFGEAPYQLHMNGKKHAAKLKSLGGGGGAVTQSRLPGPPPRNQQAGNTTFHSVQPGLKCDICQSTFPNKDFYDTHMSSIKHKKKDIQLETERLMTEKDPSCYCAACDIYLIPGVMEAHLRGAKHQRRIQSPGRAAPQERGTNSVKQLIASGKISLSGCELCKVALSSPQNAIIHFHQASHVLAVQAVEMPFKCDLCSVRTFTEELLDKHMNGLKHAIKLYHKQEPEGPHREKILAMRLKKANLMAKKRPLDQNFAEDMDEGDLHTAETGQGVDAKKLKSNA